MPIRRFLISVSSLLGAAALVFGGAIAANADVWGYDNINYSGARYTGHNPEDWYVGDRFNDKISSIRADGRNTYCEDAGFGGRSVTLFGDWNDLFSVTDNLHWGESWSDRISSWYND